MALKVMKIHEIAKLFPILPTKEMRDLRSDIAANGIAVPILVNKKRDTILDGRNRWMIASELKLKESEIPMETFKGKDEDIPGEILSRNIFRRHLNDDQRISLLAKILAPKLEEEAAVRKTKKGAFGKTAGKKGSTAKQLAEIGKTSQHKAEQADKVRKHGDIEGVIKGQKKLHEAAKEVGSKTRKTKTKTLEEEVWLAYQKLMKGFDITQHRRVKEILRGFLDNKPVEKK